MNYQTQKFDADIKIAYQKLESLSSQRNELKELIKSVTPDGKQVDLSTSLENGLGTSCMMISTGSSFVSVSNQEIKTLLKKKLSKLEYELREICQEIQDNLEEK